MVGVVLTLCSSTYFVEWPDVCWSDDSYASSQDIGEDLPGAAHDDVIVCINTP